MKNTDGSRSGSLWIFVKASTDAQEFILVTTEFRFVVAMKPALENERSDCVCGAENASIHRASGASMGSSLALVAHHLSESR